MSIDKERVTVRAQIIEPNFNKTEVNGIRIESESWSKDPFTVNKKKKKKNV